jgi:8-oxo-dGTP diphosphatase
VSLHRHCRPEDCDICMAKRFREGMKDMRVVSALIPGSRGDTLLMSKRYSGPGRRCPGQWEWPGGKVEQEESHQDALARECYEELGAAVKVGEHEKTVLLILDVRLTVSLYACTIITGALRAIESDELRWVTPTEAITTLGCTPTTFCAYEEVELWLRRQRR